MVVKIKQILRTFHWQIIPRRYKGHYITTPIFYVNAKPHLGHLYTASLADATKRWRDFRDGSKDIDFPSKLATGTDEHGQKVFEAARQAHLKERDYCDKYSKMFRDLFDDYDICYTDFVRTTDEKHKIAVQEFWEILDKNGYIYKGTYEGWYSKGDECFVPERLTKKHFNQEHQQLETISVESGHTLKWTSEENYMFRLTRVVDKVKEYLLTGVSPVHPMSRYVTLISQWFDTIEDLSISRETSRLTWGIRVPGDPTQTIYVWLDALVNYLSVVGFPDKRFLNYWPPDVQILGVDIIKFHALYWPAFLIAAGLDLPKQLIVHPHWKLNNAKMSKSFGNVVDPYDLKFTKNEAIKYFLIKAGNLDTQHDFDYEVTRSVINTDIAFTLGNCLNRATAIKLNPKQTYPRYTKGSVERLIRPDNLHKLIESVKTLPKAVTEEFDNFNFYHGLTLIMNAIKNANAIIHENAMWNYDLNQSDKLEDLNTVIYCTYETLRVASILLQPFLATISSEVLNKLAVDKSERTFIHACQSFMEVEGDSKSIYSGRALSSTKKKLFNSIKESSLPKI